jgi:hypothetical protein
MPEDLFDFVAEQLERLTTLDRLESRGTLRIALKRAGLATRTVDRKQFCVILDGIVPSELESRGVERARGVCAALIGKIESEPADRWKASHDIDEIFDRLAGT